MTITELAQALRRHKGSVHRWLALGMPRDVEGARIWIDGRRVRVRPGSTATPGADEGQPALPFEHARARREAAEAALVELRLERERQQLVRAADVAAAWAGFRGRAERELHGLVDRVVPLLAEGGPDAAGMDETLRREVAVALLQLSRSATR